MKYQHDPANAFPVHSENASPNDKKTGEEFANAFSNFCNSMSNAPKGVAIDKMLRDHRSIQQNMMRFCLAFIARMADQSHDLRNEASVKLANEIMENTEYASRALPRI